MTTEPKGFVPDGFEPDAASAPEAPTAATPQKAQGGNTDSALVGALTEHLMSYVPKILMNAATHPGLKEAFGALGNLGGLVGAVGEGIATGHPLAGLAAAGPAAWAGGKGGYRLGYLTQKFALPMSKVAEEIAPYIKELASRAVAGQGINDWAQMAEPDRKDIGVMGIGHSVSDQELMDGLITKRGMTPQQAAMAVAQGDGRKLASLMNAHIKAMK